MVVLIMGASHTGKTLLAQRILEKYHYTYMSVDLIKMGLIRSGYTQLTPEDDDELTEYLWPVVREIVKTAVENRQNLVIEGAYIPFNWRDDFDEEYLEHIKYRCLVMTEKYINSRFDDIKKFANAIENRLDDSWCTKDSVIEENAKNFELCKKHGCECVVIDSGYNVDIDFIQGE